MHLPYKVHNVGGIYFFITTSGIKYSIIFSIRSDFQHTGSATVYDFAFAPEGIELNELPSHDPRIFPTISSVIEKFFEKDTNALIFVCDSLDNRGLARKKLFSIWYDSSSCNYLDKIDSIVNDEEDDLQYFTSLLIHKNVPNKDSLISQYKSLILLYNGQK